MKDPNANSDCISCGVKFNPRKGPRAGLAHGLYCIDCRPTEHRSSGTGGRQSSTYVVDKDYHGDHSRDNR